MITRTLAAGLLATACFCAPAFAQDNTTANPPAATQPMTPGGDTNATMNNTTNSNASGTMNQAGAGASSGAMSDKFYANTAGGEWRASKFMGLDIYGADNKKIGDVRELVMSHDGSIKAVVIGVGGFLGIGEKDVAIPYNQVQWTQRAVTAANTTANNGPATSGTAANTTMANNNAAATTGNGNDVTGTVAMNGNEAYPDRGVVNATKDELKNAPTYRYPGDRNTGNAQ
jgi:sporulation protein YlmC with PRC-barrel domain